MWWPVECAATVKGLDVVLRIADHLAFYRALAPVTGSSGNSIHGEHAPRHGNGQLKRPIFLSAFAALSDPDSRSS